MVWSTVQKSFFADMVQSGSSRQQEVTIWYAADMAMCATQSAYAQWYNPTVSLRTIGIENVTI